MRMGNGLEAGCTVISASECRKAHLLSKMYIIEPNMSKLYLLKALVEKNILTGFARNCLGPGREMIS